jgi:ArsR family transcriptional regulator
MMRFMDRSTQIKAMASETRMQILRLLAEPKRHFASQWSADPVEFGVCMTLIAEALGIAQPTASRHLDILKQAKFITVKRHQKWSYCTRNDAEIFDYLDWVRSELALST